MANDPAPRVWVVRADDGKYTDACVDGGYTGIGWNETEDLSRFEDGNALRAWYRDQWPDAGKHDSGNIARFMFDIKAGDYVITPTAGSKWLYYSRVADAPYYYTEADDGCRYGHRRKMSWEEQPLNRADFSNPPRGQLTVFRVHQPEEFLARARVDMAQLDGA